MPRTSSPGNVTRGSPLSCRRRWRNSIRQSIAIPDRERSIRAISDLLADDLPLLLLYFNPTTPAARKGIKALEDFRGGAEAAQLYGTFTRNAHEWDVQ